MSTCSVRATRPPGGSPCSAPLPGVHFRAKANVNLNLLSFVQIPKQPGELLLHAAGCSVGLLPPVGGMTDEEGLWYRGQDCD